MAGGRAQQQRSRRSDYASARGTKRLLAESSTNKATRQARQGERRDPPEAALGVAAPVKSGRPGLEATFDARGEPCCPRGVGRVELLPDEPCGPAIGTAVNLAESMAHLPLQPAQTVGPGIESAASAER